MSVAMSSNRSAGSGRSTSSLALTSRWTSLDGGLLMRPIIALGLDQSRDYSLYCDPEYSTQPPRLRRKKTLSTQASRFGVTQRSRTIACETDAGEGCERVLRLSYVVLFRA